MTSKLTREERVQSLYDLKTGQVLNPSDIENIKMLARMALAAMNSELVAVPDHLTYIQKPTLENILSDTEENSPMSHAARILAREVKFWRSAPLYRHAQQPVGNEFIPKNLDRALGVLGMALPESKEEFNLQSERWIQRLIDRVIRYADEFKEQPAPVVPDKMNYQDGVLFVLNNDMSSIERGTVAMRAWNACRAAMLQGGSSPVIPDGYVMVPKDLLSELRDWAHPEIEKYCEMWEGRRDSEFPALRKVIADADALLAASPQEVK